MNVSCVANITIQRNEHFTFCNASKMFAVGFSGKNGFINFYRNRAFHAADWF
jgi:hypothetical protein